MKKIKILISILLIICTAVGVLIGYLLSNEKYEEYEGIATIIERRSATEVVAKLDTEPDHKIKNELIVFTNIFSVGDKVEIKYAKIGTNYKVINTSSIKEEGLITKIKEDPIIIKSLNNITGKIKDTAITPINPITAMPFKINNQEFKLMKEEEFFSKSFHNMDITFIPIPKNAEATLTSLEDFKVISIENIYENKKINLNYEFTNKSVTFLGIGKGLYSAKLSFKNGNIINFIFV
ncbi:MAG: hypothetical protein PHF21_01545 [Bacilli bacterium]|nr:hypothetical protein [Bacilli bacterium]